MRHRSSRIASAAAIALTAGLLAGSAQAQTVPAGSGILRGRETLKVGPGCGKETLPLDASASLAPNGTWSAIVPDASYSGTAVAANPKGSKWNFSFDGPSLNLFRSVLRDWASDLCETNVTIDTPLIKTFTFKLNKRRDTAKVQLKGKATGSSAFGAGRGSYQTTLMGPWTLAP